MLLSSARRIRLYTAGFQASPLTDNTQNNRLIYAWLSSTSDQIERYLNRRIESTSRTEYFDLSLSSREFFPKAYPITTLTSVYEDSQGLYSGSESEITDCYIGADSRSVVLPYIIDWNAPKGLRIIYTGGLAEHPVNSEFTMTSASGTPATGNYAIGATSGARGIYVSWSDPTLTIENYYGIFQSGEVINLYDNEDGTGSATFTGTVSAISKQSLAEAYPAITQACETQVEHYFRHATDFENAGTNKDGTTLRRRTSLHQGLPLLQEVVAMLNPYRRIAI
jgi:hypothetical protein